MMKGIVVALVAGLALAGGCKSKAKQAGEPVGSASGSAMASGSAPAPAPGSGTAGATGGSGSSGVEIASGTEPGSAEGSGSGGAAVSVTGVTACVTYGECRAAWDLTQMKNPTNAQRDQVKAAQPGYQKECNEAWPNQPKGETQKIQDCVKKHPKCPAALDCFGDMAVDDDE